MTFLNLRMNVMFLMSAIFGNNVNILKKHTPTKKIFTIYSDASSVASGAYTVDVSFDVERV